MDIVGGFPLADGTLAKELTGVDDHSRMCVCARLTTTRERTRVVCEGLRDAITTYVVPQQILTNNGKVFAVRFNHPPVEVLFDAICREHGIEHLLTRPRSPTTTGKIERLHRSLRAEFYAQARCDRAYETPSRVRSSGSRSMTLWTTPPRTVKPATKHNIEPTSRARLFMREPGKKKSPLFGTFTNAYPGVTRVTMPIKSGKVVNLPGINITLRISVALKLRRLASLSNCSPSATSPLSFNSPL